MTIPDVEILCRGPYANPRYAILERQLIQLSPVRHNHGLVTYVMHPLEVGQPFHVGGRGWSVSAGPILGLSTATPSKISA